MDSKSKKNRSYAIFCAVITIIFIIGVVLLLSSKTKVEYPISEYWVAKDYHHVYEKYSGSIVDVISDDEVCTLRGDYIIVETVNIVLHNLGLGLVIIFGASLVIIIVEEIKFKWF